MNKFTKSNKIFIILIISILAFIVIFLIIKNYNKLPEGSVRKINRSSEEPLNFTPLKIGKEMPFGPGGWTFAPYMEIPASQKFYVSIIQDELWCSGGDCGIDGSLIETMGGWLQVANTAQPTDKEFFGLYLPENQYIKSLVVVGDKEGKIVGLYPNKGFEDILAILKNHPDLANFDLLPGVSEFRKLKVGMLAPLKPSEEIGHLSDTLVKHSITHIPKDKKFYLYGLQKRKYDMVGMYEKYENEYDCFLGGCRYPEPDPPHDFLFDEIDHLGGWFIVNDEDNTVMIELFGLDPKDVLSGKSSLVVLTDADGIIVALHPNKTLSDTFTILSQHLELIDIEKLQDGWHNFFDL